ncbi:MULTISPECIES: hypothetical protein [Pseudonocardia]|uniref:Uncharacterized protein n=2 Tax=Pseudonocardia TaxID=1847 RepID=A0A1Y2MJT2_PSEAH|nr:MULTISPECIES: hypothetical protein [Pseudonocardia]OSY34927.1 hypothetical protein BG845_06441 [Pseudonocardia autotrophica]TDN76990.1 hypothetical protein C8E95_6211 [Pseudonocardia autotrophica]
MARTSRAGTAGALVAPWLALAGIAVTSPVVIAQRTAQLVVGGWPPGPRERREITRMWTEKLDAFSRAAVIAGTSVPGPATAARALAPIRAAVRSNARRLGRR